MENHGRNRRRIKRTIITIKEGEVCFDNGFDFLRKSAECYLQQSYLPLFCVEFNRKMFYEGNTLQTSKEVEAITGGNTSSYSKSSIYFVSKLKYEYSDHSPTS